MNKQAQLTEYITQDIIAFLVEDKKLDISNAMHLFYTSEIHEKLLDQETGLYLEGSAYIYDLLLDELSKGQILQNEI